MPIMIFCKTVKECVSVIDLSERHHGIGASDGELQHAQCQEDCLEQCDIQKRDDLKLAGDSPLDPSVVCD
jgi:hypothetical protein